MSVRCNAGHYYDPTKHSSCPHCGIAGIDVPGTVPKVIHNQGAAVIDPTVPKNRPAAARPGDGPTVPVFRGGEKIDINPVVGWLVCIVGPDLGRDYRIRSQRNFVGRSANMDICIAGDEAVSREKHATITYNPKKNTFRLTAGDSHGIVYLNGEDIDTAELSPYDRIELGRTQLVFIPFCGEKFQWDQPQEKS